MAAHPEAAGSSSGGGKKDSNKGGKKGGAKRAAGQAALSFGGGASSSRSGNNHDDEGDSGDNNGGDGGFDGDDGEDGEEGEGGGGASLDAAVSLPVSKVKKIAKLDPACGEQPASQKLRCSISITRLGTRPLPSDAAYPVAPNVVNMLTSFLLLPDLVLRRQPWRRRLLPSHAGHGAVCGGAGRGSAGGGTGEF